uniref:Uncharacterized protein n=1 Tax=Strongyloides venezuelensis TaxID=75913 RepID=A0A0K0FQJ2_STRVS
MDIDDVKSKDKKRAIVDERTEIDGRIENGGIHHGKRRKITTDGRSLVDGITATGQKNKKDNDISSGVDIVDESNNFKFTSDTLKENSIHKCIFNLFLPAYR